MVVGSDSVRISAAIGPRRRREVPQAAIRLRAPGYPI